MKIINSHYKIIIIGAGPAGSSCSLALSRLGVKDILLVESCNYNKFRIGETIPPETKTILMQLGIYKSFLSEQHEPCYGSCSYWGNDHRGYNDSILSPYGHGWHLDRRKFNLFLSKQAQTSGVKFLANSQLISSEQSENNNFELTFNDKNNSSFNVTADFVVDATGSRSVFAIQQGSKKINTDPLICLGVRFKISNCSRSISKQTHLEAVEYGWWYVARLPGDILLVTLYTDGEIIKKNKLQKIDIWLKLLKETKHTSIFISNMEIIDIKPKAFRAPSFRLDKITGKNWTAIGDAASAFDPVTSQGIIKSMSDAITVANIIEKYLNGNENKLKEFEQMVIARYEQYLSIRKYFYQLEKRWPNSPFWQKYQGKSVRKNLILQSE